MIAFKSKSVCLFVSVCVDIPNPNPSDHLGPTSDTGRSLGSTNVSMDTYLEKYLPSVKEIVSSLIFIESCGNSILTNVDPVIREKLRSTRHFKGLGELR